MLFSERLKKTKGLWLTFLAIPLLACTFLEKVTPTPNPNVFVYDNLPTVISLEEIIGFCEKNTEGWAEGGWPQERRCMVIREDGITYLLFDPIFNDIQGMDIRIKTTMGPSRGEGALYEWSVGNSELMPECKTDLLTEEGVTALVIRSDETAQIVIDSPKDMNLDGAVAEAIDRTDKKEVELCVKLTPAFGRN